MSYGGEGENSVELDLSLLPKANAIFNALSAGCVLCAILAIRGGRRSVHQVFMIAALGFSALFLAGYLWFHFRVGVIRYGGAGFERTLYFLVLGSHSVLAAILVPAVCTQIGSAVFRGPYHRRWGRPIAFTWLYVSMSGVVLYFFLRPYLPTGP